MTEDLKFEESTERGDKWFITSSTGYVIGTISIWSSGKVTSRTQESLTAGQHIAIASKMRELEE